MPLPEDADLEGALRFAREEGHAKASELYRMLAETAPSIPIVSAAWAEISAQLPATVERDRLQRQMVEMGVFARLSSCLAESDAGHIEDIVFDFALHPGLISVLGQQPTKLLASLVKRIQGASWCEDSRKPRECRRRINPKLSRGRSRGA
ncbi:hypothetical protein JL101_030985 (plasmid) [Skermanella rosea]|uniref:hypothetical protein n=1 Tax=Skermanella rosea TaxID=1817965 RepID=UPI001931B14A|nr:hypothetical protein [Skermanella rosea]UEM06911.1 hypothetical protein JL101_030985 [Skermanella rosea]